MISVQQSFDILYLKDECQGNTLHAHIRISGHFMSQLVGSTTRVKISQAITGLLAQQPCNDTVNMIEQD